MAGSLDDYRRKRDFRRTPEPEPGNASSSGGRFVVHRHEARSLHYDLRLEIGGALCSFAVPKGFSYRGKDKRLAVRTEDHPLEYLHFEGVIPPGEYGAGTMQIWDQGTYQLARGLDPEVEIATGELKLLLDGHRLRGEWHLVRSAARDARLGDSSSWLLFKAADPYEGPQVVEAIDASLGRVPRRPMPKRPRPMRAVATSVPFDCVEHVYELEFDGLRAWLETAAGRVRLPGVRHLPQALEREAAQVRARSARLDGVLVAVDPEGRPDRKLLEQVLAEPDASIPCVYYAFDVLHYDDFDLRALPLRARRRALRSILPDAGSARALQFVEPLEREGTALAREAQSLGFSGIVAKRAEDPYLPALRSSWLRIPLVSDPDPAPLESLHGPGSDARSARRGRVGLSNLDKCFWPTDGITKGDLLSYYDQVAEHLLPHLQDRPLHLQRFPDGIEGKSFYQRRVTEQMPEWLPRLAVPRSDGSVDEHVVCADREVLTYLVNLGSIDLHPWLSRAPALDQPDWAVLDLDPKTASFAQVVRLARAAGRLLRGLGATPLIKTSGRSGLHVYLGLAPGHSFEQVRLFLEGVARCLVREAPDAATVERDLAERRGRVYLDFLQNGRGQTVVPPYVVRPVPGAGVSTPLHWDELEGDLSPDTFHLRNVPARLQEVGDLFREPLPHDLLVLGSRLEEQLRG